MKSIHTFHNMCFLLKIFKAFAYMLSRARIYSIIYLYIDHIHITYITIYKYKQVEKRKTINKAEKERAGTG